SGARPDHSSFKVAAAPLMTVMELRRPWATTAAVESGPQRSSLSEPTRSGMAVILPRLAALRGARPAGRTGAGAGAAATAAAGEMERPVAGHRRAFDGHPQPQRLRGLVEDPHVVVGLVAGPHRLVQALPHPASGNEAEVPGLDGAGRARRGDADGDHDDRGAARPPDHSWMVVTTIVPRYVPAGA